MNILFLNHKKKQCGVYQYGYRLYNILKKTENLNYEYHEIDSIKEYNNIINNNIYLAIIYNYHNDTMTWLNSNNIQKKIKNICIPHESNKNYFDIILNNDPTMPENLNNYTIVRPIFEDIDIINNNIKYSSEDVEKFINCYTNDNIQIFGSFGFGFNIKGFDKIINIINDQFDNAIIKLVIPNADFGPKYDEINNLIINCKKNITKPGIILLWCHDFLTNEEIINFLSKNTMNIFLYDKMDRRGISSTIDYALSVKKPLGISNSYMFKHIYSDDICLYKTNVRDCINNSVKYCEKYLTEYSNNNLINKFKLIINNL